MTNLSLQEKQALQTISFLEDGAGWQNRFEIPGSTGRVYRIAQRTTDKTWGCSCPGWIHHRTCKHIKAMQDVLEIIGRVYPNGQIAENSALNASNNSAQKEQKGATMTSKKPSQKEAKVSKAKAPTKAKAKAPAKAKPVKTQAKPKAVKATVSRGSKILDALKGKKNPKTCREIMNEAGAAPEEFKFYASILVRYAEQGKVEKYEERECSVTGRNSLTYKVVA